MKRMISDALIMAENNIAEHDAVGMENNHLMKWQSKNVVGAVALFILALTMVQVSACQTAVQTNVQPDDPIARAKENQSKKNKADSGILAANRRLWAEKNITHYKMTVSARQGGNYQYAKSVLIEVLDGQINSISYSKSKQFGSNEEDTKMYQKVGTIEKMYSLIEERLEEERGDVFIEYNKEFGYPVNMSVGYLGVIDSEIDVSIENFEIISQ